MGARCRFSDRGRGASSSDLHGNQGLWPRVPCICREAKAGVRGQLMSDRSFLSWPFLEEKHSVLHDRVEAWAKANTALLHGEDESSAAAALAVRRLVSAMGKEG